jgi:ABC-type phosphate transport system substrate-binding protein
MRTIKRSLLSATLSLSAVVASMFAFAPSAHAQSAPAVTQNPLLPSTVTINPGGTYNTNALQYFANGATFPGSALRALTDFYGLATPSTVADQGKFATPPAFTPTGVQPAASPLNNIVQYNYCRTDSTNGRATFTGTALQALFGSSNTPCSFVTSTAVDSFTLLPIAAKVLPSAPTPLPLFGLGFNSLPPYPTFPINVAAPSSAAPLFAFADAPPNHSALNATELTTYKDNKFPTRGRVNQIPVFFGAITPVFSTLVTATPPRISTLDLCKLFDGTITSYSQLTAPLTPLSGPVKIIVRSDKSDTTKAFTAYLAAQCVPLYASLSLNSPGGFTGYYLTDPNGVDEFPTLAPNPSTNFMRAQGNDGVAALVNGTAGGAGYVEAAFAAPTTTGGPIQASLQTLASSMQFVTATVLNVRNATTKVSFTPDSPANPCVLTVTGLGTPTGYPIVAQSYALTYQNYPTPEETNATRGLFSFILGNAATIPAANEQLAQGSGFLLLRRGPGNTTAIPAINRLRIVARGCINNTANIPTGFTQGGLGTPANIIGINFTPTTPVAFTTSYTSSGAPIFTPAQSVTVISATNIVATPAPIPPQITGPIRVGTVQTPNDSP